MNELRMYSRISGSGWAEYGGAAPGAVITTNPMLWGGCGIECRLGVIWSIGGAEGV